MRFTRNLDQFEVLAAVAEYLHRRGHKMDLDIGYTVAISSEAPRTLTLSVVVEDVTPSNEVRYEAKK